MGLRANLQLQVFNTELVWEFGESKYRELLREKTSICIRYCKVLISARAQILALNSRLDSCLQRADTGTGAHKPLGFILLDLRQV
jgi:hypothetical protein